MFIVIFLLLDGFFTFMLGGFFERGEASLVSFFHLASVALFVPGAGRWHAAVVGGTPVGHDGTAADHADHTVAGDRRKIPGFLVVSGLALALTFPIVHHRELPGQSGQRRDLLRVMSAACCWRALIWRSVA